jgi:hypothetical protein
MEQPNKLIVTVEEDKFHDECLIYVEDNYGKELVCNVYSYDRNRAIAEAIVKSLNDRINEL